MRSAANGFYLAVFALLGPAHAISNTATGSETTSSETCAVGSTTALRGAHLLTVDQIDPKAIVSDACASYSTLDSLNNALSPSLKAITQSTDFFAYYRLNLYDKTCPVRAWDDETGTCGNIACKVDTLENEKDIPLVWRAKELSKLEGPKAAHPGRRLQQERGSQRPLQGTLGENVGESCVVEYDDECDDRDYCVPEDESATAKGDYVSLVENPERFTGYAGANVWDAIYRENCFSKDISATTLTGNTQPLGIFQAASDLRNVIQAGSPSFDLSLDDECLEKRVFYRIISGMHASITTHVCNDYLNQTTGTWGPNLQCYQDRLATHPERISNLYFNYALLLRAVTKLRTYLKKYTFCSGDAIQDSSTRTAVLALADAAAKQPRIFDENSMFQDPNDTQLKEDFRNRFRNVSTLMDCVGCDKCRLWGKLQTVGYGTALKVLFEYDETTNGENPPLRRIELVALINTLGRVSNSLAALGRLRDKTLPEPSFPIPENTTNSNPPLYDEDEEDLESLYPENPEEESVYDSIMAELSLVWRTYVYVLKSWIELPGKVGRIAAIEGSRLWAFWLGMPMARREWEISSPGREDL